MSKKSKRKTEEISQDSIPHNVLARQKAGVKEAAYDYLGVSIFFAVFAIVTLLVGVFSEDPAYSHRVIFGVVPILFGLAVLFFVYFLQRVSVFRRINEIHSISDQTVRIHCSKIRFRTHPVSRSYFLILYIVFIDENKQKYYYVYPKDGYPGGQTAKSLRDSLQGGPIDLVCYHNTNVVKSFQKPTE